MKEMTLSFGAVAKWRADFQESNRLAWRNFGAAGASGSEKSNSDELAGSKWN